jgi:hypothetical protein
VPITALGKVAEGSEKTSDGTLNVTFTSATQVGDRLFVALSADNLATRPSNGPFLNWIADPRGHTWTNVQHSPALAGAAAASAVICHVWQCKVTTAHQVGDVIELQLGTVTAKSAIVLGFRGVPTAAEPTSISASRGSTGDPIFILPPSASGDLVVAFVANEGNSIAAGDSDTLNGSWSAATGLATSGGSGATNVAIMGQYKIVTATGSQTWTPTGANEWSAVGFTIAESTGTTYTQTASVSVTGSASLSMQVTRKRTVAVSVAGTPVIKRHPIEYIVIGTSVTGAATVGRQKTLFKPVSVSVSGTATISTTTPGTGSSIKYWNGSAWATKPLKRWDGGAWVDATLKRWDGSAWITE